MITTIKELKQSARQLVEDNILSFWLHEMQDEEYGGFYGRMDGKGRIHAHADKGAILNARILWAFSAAYRVLGHRVYRETAKRASDYFLSHFIDREQGGVYWSVDYKGQPKDTKKQFYAIGFAVYGLSEYARATGDEKVLHEAISLYECIERYGYDPHYGGYIEAMTCSWQPISDMRLSDRDQNYPKSQNTHLHIIEPYTNLLRTLRMFGTRYQDVAERVEASMIQLINIFCQKIFNRQTNHLDLFFDLEWKRQSQTQSYGHDIECSWLLMEAVQVLGRQSLMNDVIPVVKLLAEASERGLRPDGSMIHEDGDADLHWWVQAEAVVGFLNIFQCFHEEQALQKALACYEFIQERLVDYTEGEWFWSIYADGSVNHTDDKGGFWKCPYHNTRMCLEIIERGL